MNDPVFIQWKGTDVCMDLRCPCGFHNHYDGYFAYFVRCGGCNTVYQLGSAVTITAVTDPRMDPLESV